MSKGAFGFRIAPREGCGRQGWVSGFSLVEILVACSVLAIMMVVIFSAVNHVSRLWKSSNTRVEAFQNARVGFDNLTRLLSQATLNTYWDYDNPNDPKDYIRQSELNFFVDSASAVLGGENCQGQAVFFQAPADYNVSTDGTASANVSNQLSGLLNACGFFVEFASDTAKGWVPPHVTTPGRGRYRLMQWMQPSVNLAVYSDTTGRDWMANAESEAMPVADNVITLVIVPQEPTKQTNKILPDQYRYDSRDKSLGDGQAANVNQLPPILKVMMVAIDEQSAVRLGTALKSTVDECLSGLFEATPSTSFQNDLDRLEERLTSRKINYRVFISALQLHEAKWSP